MEEKRDSIRPEEQAPRKPAWQQTKESWYDRLNVTVGQLNVIIRLCYIGLAVVAILIVLDAAGVM